MGYLESRYQPSICHLPIGSDAFKIEYQRNISSQSLRDDIVSYLGEYRFQIPRFDYSLLYSYGDNGLKIRDVNDEMAMTTKAQRAIDKRLAKGHQGISREVAELAGLTSLENQLKTAKNGDQIFWVSPPGKKEDGYGDYGFVYAGEVSGEKLEMSAIRVEQPTLKQFNDFLSLVKGKAVEYQEAEDFLANPYIKVDGPIDIDQLLFSIFNFQLDEKKLRLFESSIKNLSPHIQNFINLVQRGSSKTQLLEIFHALENYSLDLINNQSSNTFGGHFPITLSFNQLIKQYGYTPPTALGSCGSTKTNKNLLEQLNESNKLFGSSSVLKQLFNEEEDDDSHYEYHYDLVDSCRYCASHYIGPCRICPSHVEDLKQGKILTEIKK